MRSFADENMRVGVAMLRSTRSDRLPVRMRLDLKLAAAAGPNTPELRVVMEAQQQAGGAVSRRAHSC
jgi:hypothetical protein